MSADATCSVITQKKYFNSIDGLRLLASVNVVLFHLQYIGGLYDMGGKPWWMFRLIKGPAFHASLFFILGGFIFTTKFAQQITTFKSSVFLKKRFRELYPLHLITTFAMAALYIIKHYENIDIPNLLYSLFLHLSFLWSICPINSMDLNTPSWALSAMFLCYLLFGQMLKWSMCLKSRTSIVICMILSFVPLILWWYLYAYIGSPKWLYQFFHGFAPTRVFEFWMGMLLARFFSLRTENKHPWYYAIRCDVVILLATYLIMLNLMPQFRDTPAKTWFSYHIVMIPLYLTIIYAASIERGVFSRVLSFPPIQKLGRASFYPYLIHIPLMSIITFFCERVMGYKKFLHSPLNIAVFMIVLYVCAYFYVYAVRNKRREKKIS